MSMRSVLLYALIAMSSAAMPAAAQISINIGFAPPSPRYEVIPAPRVGFAWAPGYWHWENQRHIWRNGRWIEARPGSHWVADRWETRDGRHHYKPGKWERVADRGDRDQGGKGKGHGNKGKGWAKGHDR